jgi:pimeloyl-ACP methyl ester carboxylesterase
MTYDLFRDEARAALALLRARPEVDPAHLFVAGHSEGGVQALRVAAEEKDLAGVILLSTPGRRLADVMVGQLESQLTEAASRRLMKSEVVEREVASIKQGFADFVAGEDVDPEQVSSIPAIRQLLVPFMSPRAAPIGRPWLSFDPAAAAKALDVPVLVVNGDKDIQVDPKLDARALEKARKGAGKPVELVLVANANHVYKKETRTVDEIRAALATVNSTYNQDGLELAPGLVDAIAVFVAAH